MTVDFSIYQATFQVEDEFKLLLILQLQRILHEHEMNFACSLCLDSEQAEYFGEQAVWVSFEVRGKLRKYPEHQG